MKSTFNHTPSKETAPQAVVSLMDISCDGVNLTDMETTLEVTRVKIEQSETYKVAYAKQSLINILDMFDEMSPERTKNWLQSVLNKL
jgi:hypothetical protein